MNTVATIKTSSQDAPHGASNGAAKIPSEAAAAPHSIISRDICIEGELEGHESLIIEGRLKGRIHTRGDVVVAAGGKAISKVVSRLKCAAYYEVQKDGAGGRLWTRGYDKRLCLDKDSLVARVRYVERHNR